MSESLSCGFWKKPVADAITPDDLVILTSASCATPLIIDLVYADGTHAENIFREAVYRADAPFILHKDLAKITLSAAKILHERHGWTLVLKDGLRTVEAQERLAQTPVARAHPEWMREPGRLLSPPGAGAHPRGMAVDACALDDHGQPVDMGTTFDTMTAQSARSYTGFAESILKNRHNLETGFTDAAAIHGMEIFPLPSEWWDFRFTRGHYSRFTPLSDADLPPHLRMTDAHACA